jgi:hypothetical protein
MGIKTRFDRFASAIRPTEEHIAEANRQTAHMIEKLKDRLAADGSFTLLKILSAGSNAKFTSLRRTEENEFDVDLGAYYSGEGATKESLDTLLQFTRDQLRDIYPNKTEDDFEARKSAVRVSFVSGIKLNVDVAPIIRDDSLGIENGGWIPRADGWRLTSVTCHNEFIARRTAKSNRVPGPVKFNRLVRIVKWWNNQQGNLAQPSILCDCITAAAFAEVGVTDEWQTSLRHVFTFLRQHQFLTPIVFGDYYNPEAVTLASDPVVVLDPVNPANNLTAHWTHTTREAYLGRVQDAYDAMMYARSCELDEDEERAADCWCDVCGPAFRTLSEED